MSLTGNAESGYELRGKLQGLKTIHGYSAYEVAVINGFEGTEEEWLASLHGKDGESFTYDDLTEEQIAELQEGVAADAIADARAAASQANDYANRAFNYANDARNDAEEASSYARRAETAEDNAEQARMKAEQAAANANGIPIPESAEVGQIIQVAAVDETGKPTAWNTSNPIAVSAELDESRVAHFKNSLGVVLFSLDLSEVGVPLELGDLVVSAESLSIAEGGSGTFTVKLASAPNVKQTVYLALSDNTKLSVSPASLVFTPDNWSTEQTVTLTAAQDEDDYDDEITVTLTSKNVDGKSLVVTLSDDDKPTLVTDGLILHYDYTNKVDDTSDTIIDLANGVPASGFSSAAKRANGVYSDGTNSTWLELDTTSDEYATFKEKFAASATKGFTVESFGNFVGRLFYFVKGYGASVQSSLMHRQTYTVGSNYFSSVTPHDALAPYLNSAGESKITRVNNGTNFTMVDDWEKYMHAVAIFQPDGSIECYINGIKCELVVGTAAEDFAEWDMETITANLCMFNTFSSRFGSNDGDFLSAQRIYNRPLTADEIEENRVYMVSTLGLTTF